MKKNFLKKLFCCILGITMIFTFSGKAFAQTEELHPLGLNDLYEKVPNIKKAPSMHFAYKSLPTSVDLSYKFPPVGNQGRLGSCVAFAITYAYKTYQEGLDQKWDVSTNDHIFSPAYVYNQTHSNNSEGGGGSYFSTTFNLLKTQGCTTLNDMQYDGRPNGWKTQPTQEQRANAAKYKAKSWYTAQNGDYNAIKAHLAAGNAVVIGINVYPDFDSLSPSNPIFDDASGKSRGGHALCVVGYDDSKRAVKIINSWGTNWGFNGYGWISYDYIQSQYTPIYIMTDVITNPMYK